MDAETKSKEEGEVEAEARGRIRPGEPPSRAKFADRIRKLSPQNRLNERINPVGNCYESRPPAPKRSHGRYRNGGYYPEFTLEPMIRFIVFYPLLAIVTSPARHIFRHEYGSKERSQHDFLSHRSRLLPCEEQAPPYWNQTANPYLEGRAIRR